MGAMSTPSFPPPPKDGINWSNLALSLGLGDGTLDHVESRFSAKTNQWSDPEFISDPYIKVHGLCPGINYGQQVYEGLKAYRSPCNRINIFRPKDHAARLVRSSEYVSIPAVPEAHFLKSVNLAVARNAEYVPPSDTDALLYIRPVLLGCGGQLALQPSGEYLLCVYVLPGNAYHGAAAQDAVIMEEFDRAAPRGTGAAKVGGNYAPVIRWSNKARAEGFGMTLHLDSATQTTVDEFSTSAFLGIKDDGENVTLVIPHSRSVIDSITSGSCVEIAKTLGWNVEQRPVQFEELASLSEVIAAGTAASLLPIKSISRKSTDQKFVYQNGSDAMGPRSSLLFETLKNIQQGRAEDIFGWTTSVVEA